MCFVGRGLAHELHEQKIKFNCMYSFLPGEQVQSSILFLKAISKILKTKIGLKTKNSFKPLKYILKQSWRPVKGMSK